VDRVDALKRVCDSNLERRWLDRLNELSLRLPTHAQYLIESCRTRPDFYYHDCNAAIYIDGPVHDEPEQRAEDDEIANRLVDAGYLVIRFHHRADWDAVFDQYREIFGGGR